MIEFMLENRELILLHSRNPSAFEALSRYERNRIENEALDTRLIRVLRAPIRSRCAIASGWRARWGP